MSHCLPLDLLTYIIVVFLTNTTNYHKSVSSETIAQVKGASGLIGFQIIKTIYKAKPEIYVQDAIKFPLNRGFQCRRYVKMMENNMKRACLSHLSRENIK